MSPVPSSDRVMLTVSCRGNQLQLSRAPWPGVIKPPKPTRGAEEEVRSPLRAEASTCVPTGSTAVTTSLCVPRAPAGEGSVPLSWQTGIWEVSF